MSKIFSKINNFVNILTYAIVLEIIKIKTYPKFKKIYGKFSYFKDNKRSQINGQGNVTGLFLGEIVHEIKKYPYTSMVLLAGDNNSCKKTILKICKQKKSKVFTAGYCGEFDYSWNFEEDPPKEIGKYNLIVSQAILEHLIDPYKHLRDLSNILEPGGLLIAHSVMPGYEYHRYPIDAVRFYPDWFETVGMRLNLKIVNKYIRNSHLIYCYEKF